VKVLAIETAARDVGVALVDSDGTISSFVASGTGRHVEMLLPAIDSVLLAGGVALGDLDGIVVDIGPGLFTGLRAGVAAAKGLALGAGLLVVGVCSTEVLSAALTGIAASVAVALDVRRGEVAFELPGDDGPGIASLDEVLERLDAVVANYPTVLVGNGWASDRAAIEARFGERVRFAGSDFMMPSAGVLGRVGIAMLDAGLGVDAASLGVKYLREADAAITWTTRTTEGV
jgi:tRNA threonylcarbamoyladenosine biosynthesis protein TsaB